MFFGGGQYCVDPNSIFAPTFELDASKCDRIPAVYYPDILDFGKKLIAFATAGGTHQLIIGITTDCRG